jgi:hypothetical protein
MVNFELSLCAVLIASVMGSRFAAQLPISAQVSPILRSFFFFDFNKFIYFSLQKVEQITQRHYDLHAQQHIRRPDALRIRDQVWSTA